MDAQPVWQRCGAHLSVAGGLHNALTAAHSLGCDCVQIFVKNQQQWTGKPLTDAAAREFRWIRRTMGIAPVIAHAGYLINLASTHADIRARSREALLDELARCAALGITGLVLHPGSHGGDGPSVGLARIVSALDDVLARIPNIRTRILLETTAGQGHALGADLAEIGHILHKVREPRRLAVCLDTCHLFAAGYDLADAEGYARTLDLLRRHVGLRRIRCVHMNDSKGICGSRLDRHEHLGRGHLGLAAFRRIMLDPRLAGAPKILETPKGTTPAGVDYDRINLRRLRAFLRAKR